MKHEVIESLAILYIQKRAFGSNCLRKDLKTTGIYTYLHILWYLRECGNIHKEVLAMDEEAVPCDI